MLNAAGPSTCLVLRSKVDRRRRGPLCKAVVIEATRRVHLGPRLHLRASTFAKRVFARGDFSAMFGSGRGSEGEKFVSVGPFTCHLMSV